MEKKEEIIKILQNHGGRMEVIFDKLGKAFEHASKVFDEFNKSTEAASKEVNPLDNPINLN